MDFVKEMANMFIEQIPEETDLMTQLLANGNWEQVGKLAHKMKPNFLMMGMEIQKGMAKEIEHLCKETNINTEQVKTLALQLINDAKASIPIVQAEVANI
jgi:HPt (histidine-containing phosphotransfer) domain-containing protein